MNGVLNPDWLLAGIQPSEQRFQFARVNRQTYHRSAFLDHRIKPRPTEVASYSGAELDGMPGLSGHPAGGWILHTAFCCSTLLATCLDHPGRTLALREPLVLSHLAAWQRGVTASEATTGRSTVGRVLRLMERTYPGERVLIKPSNFANALLPGILSESPARKVVLMSCGLSAFLLSILKKSGEATQRLPVFLEALLNDSDYPGVSGMQDINDLNLLQQGFVLWHCQRHTLQVAQQAHPGRFYTLSMERFLQRPQQSLQAVSAYLGLGLDDSVLMETVKQGAFRAHSKDTGRQYSAAERLKEKQALESRYAADLKSALQWAAPYLARVPVEPFPGEDQYG
jgi:hypothetical protein